MDMQTSQRGTALTDRARAFEREPGLLARMFAPAFAKMLERIDAALVSGTIHGTLPDGTPKVLGGHAPGFECVFELRSYNALMRIATNGSVGLYQGWEAGEWWSPDPVPLCALFMQHAERMGDTARAKGPFRHLLKLAHLFNRNSQKGARRNIKAHYDLGNDFYGAWLDPSMVYSSGVGDCGLDAMQARKLVAMAQRLELEGGERVLEIGCGWGALAEHVAGMHGAHLTGISLSDEQLAWGRAHWSPAHGSLDLRHQDYRDADGQYDAIMSVEMVEALGREYWPTFMDCIARNLKPGGRAAIQYISMRDELFDDYAGSADFIQAYVFPGGLLIRTSEFRRLAEERGLSWQDQHDFGQDYAETLKLWRENFDRAVTENRLPAGFDANFIRLWRFYLQYCEGGFRGGGIDVHQVTLVKENR